MMPNDPKDNLSKARLIVTAEPGITGSELGRRLGLTDRQGRNLLQRITEARRDHLGDAETLLAAAHAALEGGNTEKAARLATIAAAHAQIHTALMMQDGVAAPLGEPSQPSERALRLLPQVRELDVAHFAETGEPISANKIRKSLSIGSDLAGELHRLLRDGTAYQEG